MLASTIHNPTTTPTPHNNHNTNTVIITQAAQEHIAPHPNSMPASNSPTRHNTTNTRKTIPLAQCYSLERR